MAASSPGQLRVRAGACGTSTRADSSCPSRAALRACSSKSGAAQMNRVRPSDPPRVQANTPMPTAICSMISPPSRTRMTRPFSPSAIHKAPSASSVHPSGATTRPGSASLSPSAVGSGPNVAQFLRLARLPSGLMSKALTRLPNVSSTSRTPSSVMTLPFANHRSSATRVTLPSGSTRSSAARRDVGAGHQVEAEVADVGPSLRVDDHVVGMLAEVISAGRRARPGHRPAHGAAACGRAWRR